jgi:hypothetical protein
MSYKQHLSKFFDENKYARWYCLIVDRALCENRAKGSMYFERHHILPKAKTMWPEFASLRDHPWNGVLLTPREHFICHRLLTRMCSGVAHRSMVYGLKRLTTGPKFGSRWYSRIREEFMLMNSGSTHPSFGKKASTETKAKMSASAPKTKSAEHRRKIGEANSRRIWTDSSRQKASRSARLKTLSSEHRANISKKTSGSANPMAGTKWIHHPGTEVSKIVKLIDLQSWLDVGWVIGQSAKTKMLARRVTLAPD